MKRKLPFIGIAVLVSAATGFAQQRTLEHEAMINAPVQDVWAAFTDAERMQQWMAPQVEIDLRVGGEIRSSYVPGATLGDANTIINRILSFEPQRMLSMRNVQAPAGFPHAELFEQTWSVTYFEPLDAHRTRLRMVGLGYGQGDGWDQLYAFFEQGNAMVLDQLAEVLEDDAAAPAAERVDSGAHDALAIMSNLVGGEWIMESEMPDGSVLRGRNVIEHGPDGVSLIGRGWLGNADGVLYHSASQIWREPGTHRVRFQNLNEHGTVASGEIVAEDDRIVRWDWNETALDGTAAHYRVLMNFESDDRYRLKIFLAGEDGEADQELVDANFRRVEHAPAAFLMDAKEDDAERE